MVLGALRMGDVRAASDDDPQNRPPTAAELVLIHRYQASFEKVTSQVKALDTVNWEEIPQSRWDISNGVVVERAAFSRSPMDINEMDRERRVYDVRNGSPLQKGVLNNTNMVQRLTKLSEEMGATSDPKEQARIAAEIQDIAKGTAPLVRTEIYSRFNAAEIILDEGRTSPVAGAPKGVAAMYQVKPLYVDENNGVAYLLEFGDWSKAVLKYHAIEYHFVNPLSSGHIETVEVRVEGPKDRVAALLKGVDWTPINGAISR